MFDLDTGETWNLNAGEIEYTASIVKLQIMGALLLDFRDASSLSREDSQLLSTMIEQSDNDSATELWNEVGGAPGVSRFDQLVGMGSTTPSPELYIPGTDLPGWGLTTTTAGDQLTLMRQYVSASSVLSPGSRRLACYLMEHIEIDQDWGVSYGVAPGSTVALKNGWLPVDGGWQIDSVGWIDGDNRNYVLAVMTAGAPSEPYGIDTIQAISAQVWAALG